MSIISDDWNVDEIQNHAKIITGDKNTQDKTEDGKFPFFVRSQVVERINSYSFDGEAVLTAGDGGTGKVFHYINGKFDFHQRVYCINNFKQDLDGFFFYLYFSKYFLRRIMSMTAKSTVDSVRRNMISEMLIPLPEKNEQIAIATALRNIIELIESYEKIIAKKKNIKQGTMQELLTGKRRLEGFSGEWKFDIIKNQAKITTGSRNTQDKIDDGLYPFFVRSQKVERINSYSFDGEAVLTAGDGEIGKIFHYINGKFDFHQRVYKISDFSSSLDGYFFYIYFGRYFLDRAKSMSAKNTVDSVRMEMISEMTMPLPEIGEQIAISKIIFDIDKEIQELKKQRDKYIKLKQGMMQKLLTGEIRLV